MRFILFIFLSSVFFLLTGCSGGGTPVVPDMGGNPALTPANRDDAISDSRTIWGALDIGLDPALGTFDISAAQVASQRFNVSTPDSTSDITSNINLAFKGIDHQNQTIKFDMTLTNPLLKITGYDVRAIILSDDPEYFLVNADGAAAVREEDDSISIGTFIAFGKDRVDRAFGPGEPITERFELHIPEHPKFRMLRLVIDASYPSNCPEPYGFSTFDYSNGTVALGIRDWQADVTSVKLLTGEFGGTEDIELVYDTSSASWYGELKELPGMGLSIRGAHFRGALDGITEPYVPGSVVCPVEASSNGGSLFGYIVLDTIDQPQDVATNGRDKMSWDLFDKFNDPLTPENDIRLMVFVSGTPADTLIRAREAARDAYPEIATISEEIKSRYRSAQPELSDFKARRFAAFAEGDPGAIAEYRNILARHHADRDSLRLMINDLERLREQATTYARTQVEGEIVPLQDNAIGRLMVVPDTNILSTEILLNCVFLTTKVKRLPEIASLDEVEFIEEDLTAQPQLNIATPTVNANDMWDAGYSGGTFDALVVDTGVDRTHPALSSHMSAATEKAFDGCSADDDVGHGTHIAGIIGSTNSTYRGPAYQLDKIFNGKICSPYYWDWFTAAFEWGGMAGSLPDKAEVANFSWAIGPNTNCVRDGNYATSRYFDAYTYLYDQVFCISSGNAGNSVCADDNRVTMPSDAFNVLSVGNMDDKSSLNRATDIINDSSRYGPATTSNGEPRVKPDIAAPGTEIGSTWAGWETEDDYVSMTGTSMSSPMVAAGAILAMDAGISGSAAVRTMLMITADDWNENQAGPGSDGPDAYTGFGYMNLANTALNLGNIESGMIDEGDYKLFKQSGQSVKDGTLLQWNRHCAGTYNYYPDIDLYVYNKSNNTLIDSDEKLRDNKRYLVSGTTSDVVYKINAEYLPLTNNWEYALGTSGGVLSAELAKPTLVPQMTYPNPFPFNTTFTIEAEITNDGDFTLWSNQATLTLVSGMSFQNGSTVTATGPATLNPGEFWTASWDVRVDVYTAGTKHLVLSSSSQAYGESFGDIEDIYVPFDEPPPQLDVNPLDLNFGAIATQKPFNIRNIGGGIMNWDIDDSAFPSWLSIDITNGNTQEETDIVTATVDRTGLPVDVYTHDIIVDSDAGLKTVHVTMQIPDPHLSLDPINLDFGLALAQIGMDVSNSGTGNLTWQINHSAPNGYPTWLSTSVDSGVVLESEASDHINVNVNRYGIDTGVYAYDLVFTSDGGPGLAHVAMSVADAVLYYNPSILNFGMYETAKQLQIKNNGGGILDWQINSASFPAWLSVDDDGGTTKDETDNIAVFVDRTGLDPGVYQFDLDLTSDGGNGLVQVSMQVPNEILNIEPDALDFGTNKTDLTLTISNVGNGEMNWQILNGGEYQFPSWLDADVLIGKITAANPSDDVHVLVDRTGLADGPYGYDMHFTSDGGPKIVHIDMAVDQPVPALDINPHLLDFASDINQLTLIVSNLGEPGSMLNWDMQITGMPDWIYADYYTGQINTSDISVVKVNVNRAGLNPGDYDYDIQLTSDGGNDSVHVDMTVPENPMTPVLQSPPNGYHYEVWSPLTFTWIGQPGYDGKFYLQVKYNGALYPPFSDIPIPINSLALPPALIDRMAKYGTWEWRIYTIESQTPFIKHYSEWWTIYKDGPQLLTPPDGSTVNASTQFTWNKVATVDASHTWYIAKITGVPGADPLYFWWSNTDKALLPPAWYTILKNSGATTVTWTIAATSGDPSTPGGTGMTMQYAKGVKYPVAWSIHTGN